MDSPNQISSGISHISYLCGLKSTYVQQEYKNSTNRPNFWARHLAIHRREYRKWNHVYPAFLCIRIPIFQK